VSEGRAFGGNKRTQDKVPDSLIVKEWPRQTALGEDLDTANRECVDIHWREKPTVSSCHQFWGLPSESSIYAWVVRVKSWCIRGRKTYGELFR
jgi:hypothetical protein